MNSVELIGRLVADPKIMIARDTQKKIAKFSLAVKRVEKNGDDVDFINCFTIGKNAENVEKYLKKGSQIGATGQIRTGKYKKNNETRYSFEIFLEKIYFIFNEKNSKVEQNLNSFESKNVSYSPLTDEFCNKSEQQKNFFETENESYQTLTDDFYHKNDAKSDDYLNEFNQFDGIDLSSDDLPF